MDFDLSDDQLALRDGARDLLDGMAGPARVRTFSEGDALMDTALWSAMVEQGWLGIDLPEAHGGLGLGAVELAVMLEEVGRHVAPVPLLPTVLAIAAFARAGAADAVASLLDGTRTACIGWSRDPAGVQAAPASGAWQLRGRCDPTAYAPLADVAVVVARTGTGEPGLFAVDLAAVGRPGREPAMDLTRPLGWLEFDGVPAEQLGGADAAEALLDRAAAFTAAEMLGAADRVLEMTVDYAKDRVQFGRPIGGFQAIKHRCADMLVDVEGMRSTAYWAAWSIGAGHPDASVAASTAKVWGSDAAKRVMAGGLQVHGGIGFTWEHDLHFFLKRSQFDQRAFGDASFHRARLAGFLRARVDAGESVV